VNENICERIEALIRDKDAALKAVAEAEIAHGTADTMEDRASTGGAYEEATQAANVALHKLNAAMAVAFPALLAEAREAATLRAKLAEVEDRLVRARQDLHGTQTQLNAANAQATRYRRLFEGRCVHCNNLDPVHAPDCIKARKAATR